MEVGLPGMLGTPVPKHAVTAVNVQGLVNVLTLSLDMEEMNVDQITQRLSLVTYQIAQVRYI